MAAKEPCPARVPVAVDIPDAEEANLPAPFRVPDTALTPAGEEASAVFLERSQLQKLIQRGWIQ